MKLVTYTAPFSSQLQAYRITNPEFTTPPITAIERHIAIKTNIRCY